MGRALKARGPVLRAAWRGGLLGLALGLGCVLFSPAARIEGLVPLGLKVFLALGVAALGAWLGVLEHRSRERP